MGTYAPETSYTNHFPQLLQWTPPIMKVFPIVSNGLS